MLKPQDMLRQMRTMHHAPFSLLYVTADRRRGSGGQLRELRRASLLKIEGPQILIQPYATKDVIRVSIDLILEFNDQPLA